MYLVIIIINFIRFIINVINCEFMNFNMDGIMYGYYYNDNLRNK